MSRLFDSFRSVGLVTTGPPSELRRMGVKDFMSVPCGRAFIVYDMAHISVSLISRQISSTTSDITRVVSGDDGETTFCAAGKWVVVFKRAEQIGAFEYPDRVEHLAVLGRCVIVVTQRGSVYVDRELRFELGTAFHCQFLMHPHTYLNKMVFGGGGELGGGPIQLWNFATGKLVHTFAALRHYGGGSNPASNSASGPRVLCAEQSHVLDVCAFGLADGGRISLVNLKQDVELFSLVHASKQPVTALLFQGESQLVSGTRGGEICVWDLAKQCVVVRHAYAHSRAVLRLLALGGSTGGGAGQLLVSVGQDNAIKCWEENPMPSSSTGRAELRVVRQREGHSQPPTMVRFHPQGTTLALGESDGRQLEMVTAGGEDRQVRTFHVVRDSHNKQMSVAAGAGKIPPCTSLSTSEAREKDWVNMITTHAGQPYAQVWRFEHGKMHDHGLHMSNKLYGKLSKRPSYSAKPSDVNSTCTSACISHCGNYAFVGNDAGLVSKYNLQSGRFLQCMPAQEWVVNQTSSSSSSSSNKRIKRQLPPGSVLATIAGAASGLNGAHEATKHLVRDGHFIDLASRHEGGVAAVCVDGLDESVFSAGQGDGRLVQWDASTGELVAELQLPAKCASQLVANKEGGLVACVMKVDGTVWVVDSATCHPVRKFPKPHGAAKVTAVAFSANSKWLVTAAMDGTVRVFDLATSHCIDYLHFPAPVTSLSFSPNNEFLATTHVGSLAVCVWTNKVHFFGGNGQVSAFPKTRPAVEMDLPFGGVKGCQEDDDDDEAPSAEVVEEEEAAVVAAVPSTTDIATSTITLQEPTHSTSSRWYTLVHLDLIKQRNKPEQAPDKPEQAPFFLPDLVTSDKPKQQTADDVFASRLFFAPTNKKKLEMEQREASTASSSDCSITSLVLQATAKSSTTSVNDVYARAAAQLERLSPSAVDFELLSNVVSERDAVAWLKFILFLLRQQDRFDMTQAVLNRLLRLHASEFIDQSEEARAIVSDVLVEQKLAWKRLQAMMHKTLCYVESFSQVSGF